MEEFTYNEKEILKYIRDEALRVKDCFSQYSFQSMAFSGAFFILITTFQPQHPFVGISSLLVVILVLAVARIGTHKYGTANRNYGYQLYLERISRLKNTAHQNRKDLIRKVGWEEAMRAWRIVQATSFNNLYHAGFWNINYIKKDHANMEYRWFEPKTLLQKEASWHAGSYLGNMTVILHTIAFLALIPLIITCFQIYEKQYYITLGILVFLTIVTSAIIIFRILKTRARRKILEEGLLCIHSCSIMWHAVIVAYCRAMIALECDKDGNIDTYRNLSRYLSIFAIDLNKNIGNIHEWIEFDDHTYVKKYLL